MAYIIEEIGSLGKARVIKRRRVTTVLPPPIPTPITAPSVTSMVAMPAPMPSFTRLRRLISPAARDFLIQRLIRRDDVQVPMTGSSSTSRIQFRRRKGT